jgi:signal transduction histidine kinase
MADLAEVQVRLATKSADGNPSDNAVVSDRTAATNERGAVFEKVLDEQAINTATSDGYLHFAPDWTITFAQLSAGPERSAAIVGKSLWDVYPHVRGSAFEAHYRGAMADRKPRTFRAYYAPQDLWLENRVYPAGDGLDLFYRDVGRQVDFERQLRERSRQQAAVARLGQSALRGTRPKELMDEAVRAVAEILDVDLVGVLEVAAGGFRVGSTWGYPPSYQGTLLTPEVVEQSAYTLRMGTTVVVPEIATETRFAPSQALRATGAVCGITVPLHGPDGPHGVLGGHARKPRAFRDDDVHFVEGVANVLSSALQRENVEARLRQHRDNLEELVAERTAELERASREMEAFSYTVSHDLRAPLRTVGGFAGIVRARHGELLPLEARQMLDNIGAGVARMNQLIDVLLDLGRLHRTEPRRVAVDVSALAQEVADELRRTTGDDIPVRITPGLAAHADPALLRIVLVNLLGNAWKFTRGTAEPRIEVEGLPNLAGPAFVVRDNGVGFPMEQAAQLFTPFQRLHGQKDFEGTGVGLATVRRIIERHGGTVSARGAPGQGAEFTFSLPPARPPHGS